MWEIANVRVSVRENTGSVNRMLVKQGNNTHTQTQYVIHIGVPRQQLSVSVGDTLPHTVVGVCGEFQRTGRFLQRGI